MKKLLLCLGLFYAQIAFAEGPVYISLGSNCEPAFRLNDCQLRTASYPFDWIISHFESMYRAIEDDFKWFCKDLTLAEEGTSTIDHYGHIIHHIWREHFLGMKSSDRLDLVDWESKIPLVQEKLQRRIERFKKMCDSKKKIVFIRYGHIDKDQAQRLRDLIRFKYPKLVFVLMVVKFSDEFLEPWNLENIENFSMEHWDISSWKKAFQQVNFKYELTSELEENDDESLNESLPDLTADSLLSHISS